MSSFGMQFFVILLSLQVARGFPNAVFHVHSPRSVAFVPPIDGGGSQLDDVGNGLGEPMNVIISGFSSPDVLTDAGFLNWARSIQFSTECLGQHQGAPQMANLGDGNGALPQTLELREDFGDSLFGTCTESLQGGNHFRYWRQNGTLAQTNALFLAVSKEEDLAQGHNIAPNGYDIGRDTLVGLATAGQTTFGGVKYNATGITLPDLLPVGANGVNHGIALDGNVVILTVNILS